MNDPRRRAHVRFVGKLPARIRLVNRDSPPLVAAELSGILIDASFGGLKVLLDGTPTEHVAALEKAELFVVAEVEGPLDERLEVTAQMSWCQAHGTKMILGLSYRSREPTQHRLVEWIYGSNEIKTSHRELATRWILAAACIALSIQTFRITRLDEHVSALAAKLAAIGLTPVPQRPPTAVAQTLPSPLHDSVPALLPPPSADRVTVQSKQEMWGGPYFSVAALGVEGNGISGRLRRLVEDPKEPYLLLDITVTSADSQVVAGCELRGIVLKSGSDTEFRCKPNGNFSEPLRVSVTQYPNPKRWPPR